MSAYEDLMRVKAETDKQMQESRNAGEVVYDFDIRMLAAMSIAEDLHRLADAFTQLNSMGEFNRNMGELREFFASTEIRS